MQLNTLKSAPGARKTKTRVGRGIGSGIGKTCGRGHKGQTSRTGGKIAPGFEGGQQPLHRRLPKFGFISLKSSNKEEVRTSELNKLNIDVITLKDLKEADIIKQNTKRVKIMLSGEVNRAFTVKGLNVSAGAKKAIDAAGGKVEE